MELPAPSRGTGPDMLRILKTLDETPWQYDFFALLRRIDANQDGPGLGRTDRPRDDAVRLGQRASMSFAPSSVHSLQPNPSAPLIRFAFSGLFGANGAMPLHLTEWIHDRRHRDDDDTLEAFADIFHHRFFSLLYRAWADSSPIVALDGDPEHDLFRRFIGAFGGVFGVDMQHFDDHGRRYYMSHIGAGAARPEGIEQVLQDRFGVPFEVVEFVPEWLDLDPEDSARMGRLRLGGGDVLGSSVFSRTTRFELKVGPLDRDAFNAFLPGGKHIDGLRELLVATVGMDMGWQVRLILAPGAADGARLAGAQAEQAGGLGAGTRLGYDGWMMAPDAPSGVLSDLVINDSDYTSGPIAAPDPFAGLAQSAA